MMRTLFTAIICAILLLAISQSPAQAEKFVNVYSAQKEHLIRPVLDKFEASTGITVNLTTGGKSELVSRLQMEGKNTPADLLLTVDIGNIYEAKEKGLLRAINSDALRQAIPAHLQDEEGHWYGITQRVRAIFTHKDVPQENIPTSYMDLADSIWKGKLLIRSSSNVYNQSLVAFMLAKHGEEKTKEWLRAIVANMARDPQGGDSDQLRALAAGEGQIAVANDYYFGRLVAGDPSLQDEAVKASLRIHYPNQQGDGMHVNIRGGGVTAHAQREQEAIQLLEFLVQEEAQHYFAQENLEHPVLATIAPHPVAAQWGEWKADPRPLSEIGKLHKRAIALMDEAGWK